MSLNLVCDVALALLFYELLKPVSRRLALWRLSSGWRTSAFNGKHSFPFRGSVL
jgi:hypothetical protein